MAKPTITLKNVKIIKALSQETCCFSASLYVDGEYYGVVGNTGNGGCDDILAVAHGKTYRDFHDLEKRIKETYEPEVFHGVTLDPSLESLCAIELDRYEATQDYRRRIKTKVLYKRPDGIYESKIAPHTLEKWTAHLSSKYPGVVILNNLPESEAVALLSAA